jgi:hypothetical protein
MANNPALIPAQSIDEVLRPRGWLQLRLQSHKSGVWFGWSLRQRRNWWRVSGWADKSESIVIGHVDFDARVFRPVPGRGGLPQTVMFGWLLRRLASGELPLADADLYALTLNVETLQTRQRRLRR